MLQRLEAISINTVRHYLIDSCQLNTTCKFTNIIRKEKTTGI